MTDEFDSFAKAVEREAAELEARRRRKDARGNKEPNGSASGAPARANGAGHEVGEPTSAPLFDPWQTYIVPPFPIDVLHETVQQFVETQSRIIGCDPAALAMCAICNFSAAIDHRFRIKMLRYGTWLCSPRLWVVIVGDPSDRKSPCIDTATYHLTRIEADQWDAWDREKAASEDDKIPAPPRLWTADTTVEACGDILAKQDRGLLVKRAELAGWIGSMERYNSKAGASADGAALVAATPYGTFDLPPGQYRISVTTATAVYAVIDSIPT